MSVFDSYYKKYDEWYEKNRFLYLSEIAAIKKAISKPGRGIEIGVGTGRFASMLGLKEGVDISKNMLALAKKRGIKVKHAAAEKLPYADETFDTVAIIVTLCFVKKPLKVLKEAWRILKFGGTLVVGIIDKNSRLGRKYKQKKSVFYKNAVFFSVKELKNIIKAAGFHTLKVYQTLFAGKDEIKKIQKPLPGSGKGSFIVVSAKKQKLF